MNYFTHYQRLMDRAPRKRPKGVYLERHRIIPGCMGGKYIKGNIAYLTPEEHYVAHQLLVKMYPKHGGLVNAALAMTTHSTNERMTNKRHGWLMRMHALELSERWKRNNPMHNDDVIAKISKTMTGNQYGLGNRSRTGQTTNTFTRQRMSLASKGRSKTDKHAKNISIGVKHNHETGKMKSAYENIAAAGVCKRLASCIYCHYSMNVGNLGKYHGDRCKENPNVRAV